MHHSGYCRLGRPAHLAPGLAAALPLNGRSRSFLVARRHHASSRGWVLTSRATWQSTSRRRYSRPSRLLQKYHTPKKKKRAEAESPYAHIFGKMAPLSNLDLVQEVDSFPYEPELVAETLPDLYTLLHRTDAGDQTIGYMLGSVVKSLFSIPEPIRGPLEIDPVARTIRAFDLPTEAERTKVVADVMKYWNENGTWEAVAKWRDEPWAVYGSNDELLYSVERAGAALLGVMRYGVHLTGYVRDEQSPYGMKIWIGRRAAHKSNYPNMLDNTAAGGLMTNEDPFECILREAEEEANLSKKLMRERCQPIGTVTYIYITDERSGGEAGLIYPETQWVFDAELPKDTIPTPNDGEAEGFYLWSVEQIKEALARGEFKPNCALILVDFMMRHGILTRENEPAYDEIIRKMHRKVPFPGPHQHSTNPASLP